MPDESDGFHLSLVQIMRHEPGVFWHAPNLCWQRTLPEAGQVQVVDLIAECSQAFRHAPHTFHTAAPTMQQQHGLAFTSYFAGKRQAVELV